MFYQKDMVPFPILPSLETAVLESSASYEDGGAIAFHSAYQLLHQAPSMKEVAIRCSISSDHVGLSYQMIDFLGPFLDVLVENQKASTPGVYFILPGSYSLEPRTRQIRNLLRKVDARSLTLQHFQVCFTRSLTYGICPICLNSGAREHPSQSCLPEEDPRRLGFLTALARHWTLGPDSPSFIDSITWDVWTDEGASSWHASMTLPRQDP